MSVASIWAGLTGGTPESHVLYMLFESAWWCRAACAGRPCARNESAERGVVPQVLDEALGVAPAIPLGIPHLSADFSSGLANPQEFHRCKLPVCESAPKWNPTSNCPQVIVHREKFVRSGGPVGADRAPQFRGFLQRLQRIETPLIRGLRRRRFTHQSCGPARPCDQ